MQLVFRTNSMNRLQVSSNVPKWAIKPIKICKEIILPEWEVYVESASDIDDEDEVDGKVEYRGEYLTCCIALSSTLKNDDNGLYTIVHEFTHPLLSPYNNTIANVAMLCLKGARQGEINDQLDAISELKRQTDELVVTRVSRIFYEFIKAHYFSKKKPN